MVPLTAVERRAIDEIPNVDQKLLEQFGLAQAEHPESRIELQHNRPTLTVVGLAVGHGWRQRAQRDRRRRPPAGSRCAWSTAWMRRRSSNGWSPTSARRATSLVDGPPDAATRRKYPKIARVTQNGDGLSDRQGNMDDPRTVMAANAIRALDQRLVQMPTIGGSLPFSTFSDALTLPTIGLAVVNFDNNQHAVNENLRVGHLWEAIDIFAALVTMPK